MVRSNVARITLLSFVADFWEVIKIPLSVFTTLHFTTEQQLQVNEPPMENTTFQLLPLRYLYNRAKQISSSSEIE